MTMGGKCIQLLKFSFSVVISSLKPHYITWKGSGVIDRLFIILRPAQEYFTYMKTSLPVKGCKIQVYAGCAGPLSREGPLSCQPCCNTGPRFFRLIRRTAPLSRLLRHTRGCSEPILTRILTGLHLVASYDTQGGVEDLFLPGSSLVETAMEFYCSLQTSVTIHITMCI
jgi:hypothetical protein